MKILIPNATSPKNIGDLAILTGLLNALENKKKALIHSSDPLLHTFKASPTLYTWAIFENRKPHARIKRMFELFLHSSSIRNSFKHLRHPKLNTLLNDYAAADVILFVGGGYLRSQPGVKQSLNLLMILFMFYLARNVKAKKIVAPVSVGPFAYKWQEKLTGKLLKTFDLVSVREIYSFNLLEKYMPKKVILSTDTSLLLNFKMKQKPTSEKFILGFTIRKWLSKNKQAEFEKDFYETLLRFSRKTGAAIQPIIQVDAPEYGEDDKKITENISKKLRNNSVEVLPIQKVTNLKNAQDTYSGIDLLLGMRMHSNILAALVGTPFVAVSYEYKTEGISKDLGVAKYCIPVQKVTHEKLYNLLIKGYKDKKTIQETLRKNIARLSKLEMKRWSKILQA